MSKTKEVWGAHSGQDRGLAKVFASYSLGLLTPLPCNVTLSQSLDSQAANHPTLKEEDWPGLPRWAGGNHKGPLTWNRRQKSECQSDAPWERLDWPNAGFKDGGRGHGSRGTGEFYNLEKARKQGRP